MTSLSSLTVEQLADGICPRAGRVAAAEAELRFRPTMDVRYVVSVLTRQAC